eukprot:TRINITY_DN6997_c0_g1_i3.p1 TRINITY_DN6997_c0_g1~~TRINITY_DN6997_c0_g1_i3.p1  ORF type:complete len:313 (+),score=41.91 TRINITY_DN6997_c0_g1_i3:412-1350(+)
MSLESLLLSPVQHGPRLILILKEVHRHLPVGSDKQRVVMETIQKLDNTMKLTTTNIATEKRVKRKNEIASSIKDADSLALAEKELIYESRVSRVDVVNSEIVQEDYLAYVFADMLIFVDFNMKSTLKVYYHLEDVQVIDIPDSPILDQTKNAVQLCIIPKDAEITSFLLYFESTFLKTQWLHVLYGITDHLQNGVPTLVLKNNPPPDVSNEEPSHKGHLNFRVKSHWRYIYVEVKKNYLFYYQDEVHKEKPIGFIEMDNFKLQVGRAKNSYEFKLAHLDGSTQVSLRFKALSGESWAEWMTALKRPTKRKQM